MTTDRDFDRQLGSWFDERATTRAPDGLLERGGITRREVGPRFRQDVGMEIDPQHYFGAAAGAGTCITWPHFLQVRSCSSA